MFSSLTDPESVGPGSKGKASPVPIAAKAAKAFNGSGLLSVLPSDDWKNWKGTAHLLTVA
jgi:hypothetical protein